MKFQIELRKNEFVLLRELAEAERRGWREQAAFLLAQALKAEGGKERVSNGQQQKTDAA